MHRILQLNEVKRSNSYLLRRNNIVSDLQQQNKIKKKSSKKKNDDIALMIEFYGVYLLFNGYANRLY